MISTNLIRIALFSATLAFGTNLASAAASGPAPAKGTGTRQTHHCKLADGTMDMTKTKKACLAGKGTWARDAASAPMAAAPSMASGPMGK